MNKGDRVRLVAMVNTPEAAQAAARLLGGEWFKDGRYSILIQVPHRCTKCMGFGFSQEPKISVGAKFCSCPAGDACRARVEAPKCGKPAGTLGFLASQAMFGSGMMAHYICMLPPGHPGDCSPNNPWVDEELERMSREFIFE